MAKEVEGLKKRGNPNPGDPSPSFIRWILRDKQFEKLKVFEKMYVVVAETKSDSKIGLYIGLAIQAAGIVWWASNLNSRVQHNDFQIQIMGRDVSKNSNFVELWPAGKWGSGSLPDDVRQNLKLESLEKQVEKLTEDLYKSKIANGHD